MSPRLYTLTVLTGALTWAMFGMSLATMLQAFDAGTTPNWLELLLVTLWFIMGAGDVWWLLRFGAARPVPRPDIDAPAA